MDVDNWFMFIGFFFTMLNKIKSFRWDIFISSLYTILILYFDKRKNAKWQGQYCQKEIVKQ